MKDISGNYYFLPWHFTKIPWNSHNYNLYFGIYQAIYKSICLDCPEMYFVYNIKINFHNQFKNYVMFSNFILS